MPFGTGRPSGRSWELEKNRALIFVLCLIMASFTACGYSPSDSKSSAPSTVGSLDPRDLATPPQPKDGITLETPTANLQNDANAPQDALTQAGHFEPRPGGMLGALGVNLDTYFAEDIQDPIVRIKRLERAFVAIQGDLKTVAPPIQRLVSTESDIQELVTQLQILLENDSQPSSQPPAAQNGSVPKPETAQASPASPIPQLAQAAGVREEVEQTPPEKQATPPPTPPPTVATPPPKTVVAAAPPEAQPPPPTPSPANAAVETVTHATSDTPSVVDLRIGEHPDKIRLVLDLNAKADFTADLDNEEHILVVELPGAGWLGPKEKTFSNSPLLKSYKVEAGSGGKGSMLILQLTKASGILAQQKLEPEGGQGQRIAIDLKM